MPPENGVSTARSPASPTPASTQNSGSPKTASDRMIDSGKVTNAPQPGSRLPLSFVLALELALVRLGIVGRDDRRVLGRQLGPVRCLGDPLRRRRLPRDQPR